MKNNENNGAIKKINEIMKRKWNKANEYGEKK